MGLCQNLHEFACTEKAAIRFFNIDYEVHPLVPHVTARVFDCIILVQGLSPVNTHGLTDTKLHRIVRERIESPFELITDVLIYSRYYIRMGKVARQAGRIEEAVLQFETGVGVNKKFKDELAQQADRAATNLALDLASKLNSLAAEAINAVVAMKRANGVIAGIGIHELDRALEYARQAQTFSAPSNMFRALYHHSHGVALKNRADAHTRGMEDLQAYAMYKQAARQIYHGTVVEHIDPEPEAAAILSYLESKIGTKAKHLCSFLEVNDQVAGLHWKRDLDLAQLWGINPYDLGPMWAWMATPHKSVGVLGGGGSRGVVSEVRMELGR
jgi:tetratricopeptide (TPR) repeat protein